MPWNTAIESRSGALMAAMPMLATGWAGAVIAEAAGDQRARTNAGGLGNRHPAHVGLEADGGGRRDLALEEMDGAVGRARRLPERGHDEIDHAVVVEIGDLDGARNGRANVEGLRRGTSPNPPSSRPSSTLMRPTASPGGGAIGEGNREIAPAAAGRAQRRSRQVGGGDRRPEAVALADRDDGLGGELSAAAARHDHDADLARATHELHHADGDVVGIGAAGEPSGGQRFRAAAQIGHRGWDWRTSPGRRRAGW